MNFGKVITLLIALAMLMLVVSILVGCASTTYVPVPCAKPAPLSPLNDYMSALNASSAPPEFVKACIATRLSALDYQARCEHVMGAL